METKNTVFGHKKMVEIVGYVSSGFSLSKGRKKTEADKTDSLHLNCPQQYKEYFQTFCGLQPKGTYLLHLLIVQGDTIREFWAQLWADIYYPCKASFKAHREHSKLQ